MIPTTIRTPEQWLEKNRPNDFVPGIETRLCSDFTDKEFECLDDHTKCNVVANTSYIKVSVKN